MSDKTIDDGSSKEMQMNEDSMQTTPEQETGLGVPVKTEEEQSTSGEIVLASPKTIAKAQPLDKEAKQKIKAGQKKLKKDNVKMFKKKTKKQNKKLKSKSSTKVDQAVA